MNKSHGFDYSLLPVEPVRYVYSPHSKADYRIRIWRRALLLMLLGWILLWPADRLIHWLDLKLSPRQRDYLVGIAGVGIIVVGICYAIVSYVIALRKARARLSAISAFAQANHLTPEKTLQFDKGDTPFIFGIGHRFEANEVLNGKLRQLPIQLFRYTYFLEQGGRVKYDYPYTFSGIKITLPKHFPHVVLDSRRNDGFISSIPRYFDDSQRIELEGDFNNYFDLFAPKEYEIEALNLMSPEFMNRLIKFQTPFDVEIDGYNAYIIAKGDIYTQSRMNELMIAANALIKDLKAKMDTWKFKALPHTMPELISHTGEKALRIGRWRISTFIFSLPLVVLYILTTAKTPLNWYVFAFVAALAIAILIFRRKWRRSSS